MRVLVLGGTAWLGREVCRQAVAGGHQVWCLARGESGPVADGVTLLRADRRAPNAYADARGRDYDSVVEVGWQPAMVAAALTELRERTAHWTYVSSGNVYASHANHGADETVALLEPTAAAEAGQEIYGEAKVACELACRAFGESGLLITRSGLIGGPGDVSDRAGYWVARAARDPLTPMLVPAAADGTVQVVDVRDLAAWILRCAERGVAGTFDAVGRTLGLDEWIRVSREIGGHTGEVVAAEDAWLLARGVGEFMGPDALPLWLADPDWQGFCARSGAAAQAAGLALRSPGETIRETLAWERELGLDRVRESGISAEREAALINELRQPAGAP